MMGKWLLTAVAVATAALALFLWRSLGEPSHVPTPPPSSKKTVLKTAAPVVKPPASLPGPPTDTVAVGVENKTEGRPKPTEKEIEMEAITRFRGGPVVMELYARGAPCYQGESGRSEKMTIGYHLKVEDGNAQVHSATLISSDIGNRRLEDCVVKAIEGHSWPVADGFEVDENNERASLSILGLQKRKRILEPTDD